MKSEVIAIILVILAVVGVVLGALAYDNHIRKGYTVELIARTTEHGNWYPKRITVPLGEESTIFIRNIDTLTHGFSLPDFGIVVKEIKAGNVAVVKIKPEKKGVFRFMCTVWCSNRHLEMTGELVVE